MKKALFGVGAIVASLATVLPAAPATGQDSAIPAQAALTAADRNGGNVAERVEHFPAFAGIRVTPDNSTIEVYVTRPEAAVHSAAIAAAGGAPVKLTTVRHTYASLRALRDRVAKDRAALAADGIALSFVAVRDELNKVGIGITGHTAEKAALLARRYGDRVVVTAEEGSGPYVSRAFDNAPWNGGAFIYTSKGGHCTTGPAVKNSAGEKFLLTAGHCYVNAGQKVTTYTKSTWQKSPNYTTGPFLGNAKAELTANGTNGYDVAVIDVSDTGSASGLNFRTDPPEQDGTYGSPQKRTIRAVVGTPACASGAFSGERCAAEVDVFDGVFYWSGGGPQVHHANRLARNVTSEPMAGPGDSGGPVYQVQSDGLAVGGFILGGSSGLTCMNNSYYYRGAACDDKVWFAGIGSIQGYLGMTLYV